jgi:hypothetical protein
MSVQRRAGDPADRLVQLAAAAWAIHPIRTEVVFEVDLAVLPPHRMVEFERDVNEFVSETGRACRAGCAVTRITYLQVGVGALALLDDRQP